MLVLALLLACGDSKEDTNPDTSSIQEDSSASQDSAEQGDSEDNKDTADHPSSSAVRVAGTATWTLTFDDTAKGLGFFDCSYSRDYQGVQYLDQPWLCGDCEVQTGGVAQITEGADCVAQISSSGVERYEAWGFSDTTFFRSTLENYRLAELSDIQLAAEGDVTQIGWESENTLSAGGTMSLAAVGSFTWTVDNSTPLENPNDAPAGPYACGWPQNNPGNLTNNYALSTGSVFPNARLRDQCGEPVDLWDFYGQYLVIDNTQPDCPPCRSMAETAESFTDSMKELGIDALLVSIMGDGLNAPIVEPSESTVDAWVSAYDLKGPVLADRGFGYAVMPSYFERDYGFPAWVVVGPDMKVLGGKIGFGSGSWDEIREIILNHAGQ